MNPSLQTSVNSAMNIQYDISHTGWSMPLFHYHDMYEIYLLEKGKRTLFINEHTYKTEESSVYLLKPYMLHRSDGDTAFKGICLHFSEQYLDNYYSAYYKDRLLKCFSNIIINLDERSAAQFRQTAGYLKDSDKEDKALHLPLLLHILNNSADTESAVTPVHERISDIINYINENYTAIKSIEQLAQHFYLSKNYLGALFKQQTGMSFIKYINTLKIQYACYRLSSNEYSISEIADECGFESPSYFCRAFKKITNCSPTEYRIKSRKP